MNLFDKVTGMRRLFRGLCNVVLLGALMMVVANVMGQPDAPTDVKATITGTEAATGTDPAMHEFTVEWKGNDDATSYEVGRVVGGSLASVTGNDIEFASYGESTSPDTFVQKIAATTKKRFVHLAVRAVNADGESAWERIAKPLRMAAPDAVDLMTPTVNGNEVTLDWNLA